MSIYDLTLCGPLHQGEFIGINREVVLDWIPSDTLFAALIMAWAQLGDIKELAGCDPFTDPPSFLLTSAFPRAGKVRFYPAPARIPGSSGLFEDGAGTKTSKKIRWISSDILALLVTGQSIDINNTNFLHGGTVWLSKTEYQQVKPLMSVGEDDQESLWRVDIVPHVTVDRVTNASNLFHSGRVIFNNNCGLWFSVRGRLSGIPAALNYLSDSGLGGLRSSGHGSFTWEGITGNLPEKIDGWGFCLSRFAPKNIDDISRGLQARGSAYKLTVVGGWCQDDNHHAWRRRTVRMVSEGALLPSHVKGGLVDVHPLKPEDWLGPQRKVYRFGFPFFIPAGKLVEV